MRPRRLIEPTRPVRHRSGGSGTSHSRSRRGRPARGARPPKAFQPGRRRRRRVLWARITAFGLCLGLVASLAWLVGGPWLRVRAVSWEGAGWTPLAQLEAIVQPILGESLLLIDSAGLAAELGTLPAVERASVDITAFGEMRVSLVEGGAVAVWQTSAARLLLAEDGTVIGVQSRDARLPASLVGLPLVDDLREASHDLTVGDAVARQDLEGAVALSALPGSRFGSQAATLTVELDPTYGFVVSSPQAGWRAAFGYYGMSAADTPETTAARIEAQVAAVRTLFASHPEAQIAWVDARNPGRVYFRARG